MGLTYQGSKPYPKARDSVVGVIRRKMMKDNLTIGLAIALLLILGWGKVSTATTPEAQNSQPSIQAKDDCKGDRTDNC